MSLSRPTWRGLPVPWVVRWTEELCDEPFTLTPSGLIWQDETLLDRDRNGVLWSRELPRKQGQGEPEFATMSTRRQRKAMLNGLCQVCGDKMEPPFTWLMAPQQMEILFESGGTINPPTCIDCVSTSLKLCPHLRGKGYVLLTVSSYELVAIYGEVATPSKTGQGSRANGVTVPLDHKLIPFTMAKQAVVTLSGVVEWDFEEDSAAVLDAEPEQIAIRDVLAQLKGESQ